MLNLFLRLRQIALGALLGLCCGCSEPAGGTEVPAEVRLYIQSDPISFDPRVAGDPFSQVPIRGLFCGLMRIGPRGSPEFATANAVSISEDGCVYTFKLRPTCWTNELPVVAGDFEWSWKGAVTHEVTTSFAHYYFLLKNAKKVYEGACAPAELGVKALDDATLEITLEHPAPFFLEFLTNPIFSPVCRAVAEKKPRWANATDDSYVTNGPFTLKERKQQDHITVVKNFGYWDKARIKAEQITYSVIVNPETAFRLFLAGELDWFGNPCGDMPQEKIIELKQKGLLQLRTGAGFGQWLICNTSSPALASKKIRFAIAHALNRKELCFDLLQCNETPAFSILPTEISQLNPATFEDNRPDLARALFEEGLAELGYTRETFPQLGLVCQATLVTASVVGAEHEQLRKVLGIELKVQPHDRPTFLKRVFSKDFQLAAIYWSTCYMDPSYNLEAFRANVLGEKNEAFEKFLDQANASATPEERNYYFRRAETELMTALPVIPVYYHPSKYAKSPKLSGEAVAPVGVIDFTWIEKAPH